MALQLPLPPEMTEALGIHQSDVIIRSAIIAGLADLRANSWLLKYVFASLPRDELTRTAYDYGEQEVARAEEWFLKTNIPVFMNTQLDSASFPCITIGLQESVEAEATLGDVHYVPAERTQAAWPALAGPFHPEAYAPATGVMKLPESIATAVVLAPGMVIIDSVGQAHSIIKIVDDVTVQITANTIADFTNALLKGAQPQFVTTLESIALRETYQIGLYVHGTATHLTYLHSIVTFVLSRYKETLLEARGFERSTLSWSSVALSERHLPELVFARTGQLTGFVRNYWPKLVVPTVDGIEGPISIGTPGSAGVKFVDASGNSSTDEEWLADQDSLLANVK